jgi:hypothetical protein
MSNPIDQVIKLAQKCVGQIPVIVLGSGASAQYGISGMSALKDHLLGAINPTDPKEKDIWNLFAAEIQKIGDLEMALHNVHLPPSLEARVVSSTRDLIIRNDEAVFHNLINGKIEFALSGLVKFLLRTTHPRIQIVTTNYDRIPEYACDAAKVTFDTGFHGGYFRIFEPRDAVNSARQIVEILKVHGSLDWFMDEQQTVISLPDSVKIPASYLPLLVTPGTGKYMATHEEPFRTIITRSDAAFATARSVFCVGYGFNDRHIQPKLTNRVLKEKIPILILARTLTQKTKDFLNQCKHPNYLAIEMSGTGSRAFCLDYPAGVDLTEAIWEFGKFVNIVVGG